MNFHYTDTELKELLQSMVVLIDTREQENRHITKYLDSKKIKHKSKKLDFADYSFMLPANEKLSIPRDLYFSSDVCVERKNSLEELSGNFTNGRERFEHELIMAQGSGAKLHLMVEDPNGYYGILNQTYRTNYNPKSYWATLQAYKVRYELDVSFIHEENAGMFIYSTFYYFLREKLKRQVLE